MPMPAEEAGVESGAALSLIALDRYRSQQLQGNDSTLAVAAECSNLGPGWSAERELSSNCGVLPHLEYHPEQLFSGLWVRHGGTLDGLTYSRLDDVVGLADYGKNYNHNHDYVTQLLIDCEITDK